jgi:hypothetical protein
VCACACVRACVFVVALTSTQPHCSSHAAELSEYQGARELSATERQVVFLTTEYVEGCRLYERQLNELSHDLSRLLQAVCTAEAEVGSRALPARVIRELQDRLDFEPYKARLYQLQVCVCVSVRARACVRACLCVRARACLTKSGSISYRSSDTLHPTP